MGVNDSSFKVNIKNVRGGSLPGVKCHQGNLYYIIDLVDCCADILIQVVWLMYLLEIKFELEVVKVGLLNLWLDSSAAIQPVTLTMQTQLLK